MINLIHSSIFAERYSAATLIHRLFSEEASRYRLSYAANIVLMGVIATCTALSAYLIGHVVNETYLAHNFPAIIGLSLITIVLFTTKGFASYGQGVLLAQIGNDILARNQRRIIDKLLCENLEYFADRQSATVMAQVDYGTRSLPAVLGTITTAVGRDALSLVGLGAVMIVQDPFISVIALVAMPAAVLSARRLIGRMRRSALDQLADTALIMEIMQECLQGLRIVKAFGLENVMRKRIETSTEAALSKANEMARLSNRSAPLMEALGGFAIALVFLYGGYRVIVTNAPPGEFVSFITAFLLAYEPAKRLARLQIDLSVKLVGVRLFYEMLDSPATEPDDSDLPALSLGGGCIEFNNVEFSYRPGRNALRGLTFIAEQNKVTALVGPSGGGKSTAFSLLLRLYEADKGEISIDQQDITAVSRSSLRRQIAYVGQEVYLFHGTVRENIAYGNLLAGEDEIVAAAKAAQAHDFIVNLPNGYETPVGEHGLQLSSGQRQRISIARALLKDARIILLDEPTSSLDGESEHLIRQALARLCSGRTTLVIAHRLNTVTDADCIHVVENGVVVESGRHEELLDTGGRYASLYRLLLSNSKNDEDMTEALPKQA
jgi:subfamily B ATP-binding cassette protein MsbA